LQEVGDFQVGEDVEEDLWGEGDEGMDFLGWLF